MLFQTFAQATTKFVDMGEEHGFPRLKRDSEARHRPFNEKLRIRRRAEQRSDLFPFRGDLLRLHRVLRKTRTRLLLVLRGVAPPSFHDLGAVVEAQVERKLTGRTTT